MFVNFPCDLAAFGSQVNNYQHITSDSNSSRRQSNQPDILNTPLRLQRKSDQQDSQFFWNRELSSSISLDGRFNDIHPETILSLPSTARCGIGQEQLPERPSSRLDKRFLTIEATTDLKGLL